MDVRLFYSFRRMLAVPEQLSEAIMGEAKRRRSFENQGTWFHGSNQKFERWLCPPPSHIEKPELIQHAFVSLTASGAVAARHGTYVCQATMIPNTQVIDLREPSEAGKIAWQRLKKHSLASQFLVPDSYERYVSECKTGAILRPTLSSFDNVESQKLSNLTAIAQGHGSYSPVDRAIAGVQVQNVVRSWIEAVLQCAREGYDAVICSEKSHYKNFEILNLYIFSQEKLSDPLWA